MNSYTCKTCGYETDEQCSFCPRCGSRMTHFIYCRNCGKQIEDSNAFCPFCGTRISSGASGSSCPPPDCSGSGYGQGQYGPTSPFTGKTPDRVAAGLFAIFLGGLGIQYFYLGKVLGGILSIVLSLCSCGIWTLITLIQGILMLTMSDEDFRDKYVMTTKDFPIF